MLKEECSWLIHFNHKYIQKYTMTATGWNRVKGEQHDRFGVDKEKQAEICLKCVKSEKTGNVI